MNDESLRKSLLDDDIFIEESVEEEFSADDTDGFFIENCTATNNIQKAPQVIDITDNSFKNNNAIPYIISVNKEAYFPLEEQDGFQYETPILGMVEDIYVSKLDYIVGMEEFDKVLNKLGIGSNDLDRVNKIYSVINTGLLEWIKKLDSDDIQNIGWCTSRVDMSLNTMVVGFDEYVLTYLQQKHIQDILEDLESGILHKFIQLNYLKNNLIIHLYPYVCMQSKDISLEQAQSYCISIMWATLACIVDKHTSYSEIDKNIVVKLLKQVFYSFNPILTTMVFTSTRALTSENYSFIQEMRQLGEANKHLTGKQPINRISFRWSPKSNRFEDYIAGFKRIRFDSIDELDIVDDVRGDSNGKRYCKYDCRIKKEKLITQITICGQNIMRDITGFYTTPIYGLVSDSDYLKCLELNILFTILTATEEHEELFKRCLMKSYEDVRTNKVKFLTKDEKSKRTQYTTNMVTLAVERLKKQVFKDLKPNNDYYIATRLVEHFNMKRNIPKDLITILKFADLPEDKLEVTFEMIERHKRKKIVEMVKYAKELKAEAPKHTLHELYNYLCKEGFRL